MDSLHYQLEYTGRKRQWSHCECIYTALRRRLRIDIKQRKRGLRNTSMIATGITLAEARRYAMKRWRELMWAGESPKTRTPPPGNLRVILQGLDLVKRFMMCSELMDMTS